jgi:hypothetical protein
MKLGIRLLDRVNHQIGFDNYAGKDEQYDANIWYTQGVSAPEQPSSCTL